MRSLQYLWCLCTLLILHKFSCYAACPCCRRALLVFFIKSVTKIVIFFDICIYIWLFYVNTLLNNVNTLYAHLHHVSSSLPAAYGSFITFRAVGYLSQARFSPLPEMLGPHPPFLKMRSKLPIHRFRITTYPFIG